MIPNPYLGDMRDWSDFRSQLRAAAAKRPFQKRIAKAFWRGAISNWDREPNVTEACAKDHGNYATPRGPRGDLSGTNHLSRGPIFRANVYHLVRRPLTTGRPRGRR